MSLSDQLKSKPWMAVQGEVLREISIPKGFVTEEERQCYYYLARNYISGVGQIIDGGACFGASAYCFAAGLARNPSRGRTKVHSYDRFLVSENYVADMIKSSFRPLTQDWWDDFFDIFEYQTGKYRDHIVPHKGDFMHEKWNREPVELLFIDIAKTKELHDHCIDQFYPYLIPGKSLLLHQDFYFCWLPYIHIAMQYLAHRFETVDPFIPSASRLYLLKDPLTSAEIDHVKKLGREERIDLLDKFIDGETGNMKGMAHATKLCQLWHDKNATGYQAERAKMAAEFDLTSNENWAQQVRLLDDMKFEPA